MVIDAKTLKFPSSWHVEVAIPADPKDEGVTSEGNPVSTILVALEVPNPLPPVLRINANESAFTGVGLYLVQRIVKVGSTDKRKYHGVKDKESDQR